MSGEEQAAVERAREEKKERKVRKRGPGKPLSILQEKMQGDGERIMTIRFFPWIKAAPRWKWAKKAVKILRERILKLCKYFEDPTTHKKIRPEKREVWISPTLNALIWSRGAKNPPRRVRVRIIYKFLDPEKKSVELRVFPAEEVKI